MKVNEVRRTLPALALLLVMLVPSGYYQAGLLVYAGATAADPACGHHAPFNDPSGFTPHLWGTDLFEAGATNLSSEATPDGFDAYAMPAWANVSIPVADEPITLAGWMVEVDTSSNASWVVLVHGIRSCKANHEVLLPAGMLVNAGVNVLLIDMRDHWESTLEDGQVSAGQKEWRDVVAAWSWLQDNRGADPQHIGLFGASMGAGTAAIAFAQEPEIQSVFLDSPFSSMDRIIEEELAFRGYPVFLKDAALFAGRVKGQDIVEHEPLAAASHIGERRMTVVHGLDDQRIRIHHGQAMCDEATANAADPSQVNCWFAESTTTFTSVNDGQVDESHVTLMLTHTSEYEATLLAWASAL